MTTLGGRQGQVESFWNSKPCDSDRSALAPKSREYFLEIERERYRYQHHIPQILSRADFRGKRVLEIGTGVGTDARHIIGKGGLYIGVNVDQGSTDMTASALEAFALPGTVERCSATSLKYDDESFDVIYSFGVLHHIPDVEKAISEIYRVLKPSGTLLIMLYNRSSINYRVEIMFLRKLFLHLLTVPGAIPFLTKIGFPREKLERHRELYRMAERVGDDEWLSRNTDGPDNPYSRVYGRSEIEALLSRFRILRQEIYFLDARHWGILGGLLPRAAIEWLGRRWGWHRVVYASKDR